MVGTTRDGMVWVWGTDWLSEPQYPVETHAMLLMNRMKKVVGLEQTPVSRDGTLRYIAEPAPVFQFLALEGLGPPLIEFLGGTTTNP